MDLIRLDKDYGYQPDRLIEGHETLIWSERFSSAGDFERTSFEIEKTLGMLPIADPSTGLPTTTVVSLRDTNVPMVVESHTISKSLTGAPFITTRGRSYETVLDRRTTVSTSAVTSGADQRPNQLLPGTTPAPWTTNKAGAAAAAHYVMSTILSQPWDQIEDILIMPWDPAMNVGSARDWQVDPGELYSWVLAQVTANEYGLRAIRPLDISQGGQVAIEIYKSADLTEQIMFDTRFDQFTDSTYLLSTETWKNVDQVFGANGALEHNPEGTMGLERRVKFNDQASIATSPAGPVLTNLLQSLGDVDLSKFQPVTLFTGEIAPQQGDYYESYFAPGSPLTAGKYRLGDIVRLAGDYGLSRFMRIEEVIRSDGPTGYSIYPTFGSLNDGD